MLCFDSFVSRTMRRWLCRMWQRRGRLGSITDLRRWLLLFPWRDTTRTTECKVTPEMGCWESCTTSTTTLVSLFVIVTFEWCDVCCVLWGTSCTVVPEKSRNSAQNTSDRFVSFCPSFLFPQHRNLWQTTKTRLDVFDHKACVPLQMKKTQCTVVPWGNWSLEWLKCPS